MRKSSLSTLIASVLLAATASSAASDPGSGHKDSGDPVVSGAVFSNPTVDNGDGVGQHIRRLVDQVSPGEQIRVANFVISGDTGMDFTESLLGAHDRGVQVQVILDGWQIDKPAAALLIDELGTDKSAGSWVHVCGNLSPEGTTSSCIGTKGQHNKFYLFSKVGDKKNVIVQSSANFTDRNVLSYWNNAVTLVGNHRLYGAYNEYFSDMLKEEQDPDYHWSRSTGGPDGPVTVSFFPSVSDPVEDRLRELGCKQNGRSEIRIGMSEWDGARAGIAQQLAQMQQQGCQVKVVHGPIDDEVRAIFDSSGIDHRALSTNEMPGRIHSKYLIAKGLTGRQSGSQLVITGSHNFNHTSLHRNDETYLEIRNRDIYKEYEENFETMWNTAVTE